MKISVLMCTFNGEKYIEKQLQSILYQTKKVDEIVICDDKSTDNTCLIVAEILSKYNDVQYRLICNRKTLGPALNFQNGMQYCNGDIIFLSDQDDVWIDSKVHKMYYAFEKNQDCVMCFSNAEYIDERGKRTGQFVINNYQSYEDLVLRKLRSPNGCLMAVRRSANIKVTPYYISTHFFHDLWLGYSLMALGTIVYIDERLVYYRKHESSITQAVSKVPEYVEIMGKSNSFERRFKLDIFSQERYITMIEVIKRFSHRMERNLHQRLDGRIYIYNMMHQVSNQNAWVQVKALLLCYFRGMYYYIDSDSPKSTLKTRLKRFLSDLMFVISNNRS